LSILNENVVKKLSEKSFAVQTILSEEEEKNEILNSTSALDANILFAGSECASPEEIRQLVKYLEDKQVYETVLEYRGSLHGWKPKDFH
jgi:S-methylmethionine-dependent homocysteine/selenocysteine methylase